MPDTFTLIASSTLGSAASNITFSSIPSTYTDLVIKFSGRASASLDIVGIQFNASTSGYTFRTLRGSGAAAASFTQTSFAPIGEFGLSGYISNDTSTFCNHEIYIPNYAGSTNKSFSIDGVQEANATTAYSTLTANLWSNTAAITSIKIYCTLGANIETNSTAYLYGVKNA
jgi:hypothetical protein